MEWMYQIGEEFSLHPVTIEKSCYFLDKISTVRNINEENIQLYSILSLLLLSKYNEEKDYHLDLAKIEQISNIKLDPNEYLNFEFDICKQFDFSFNSKLYFFILLLYFINIYILFFFIVHTPGYFFYLHKDELYNIDKRYYNDEDELKYLHNLYVKLEFLFNSLLKKILMESNLKQVKKSLITIILLKILRKKLNFKIKWNKRINKLFGYDLLSFLSNNNSSNNTEDNFDEFVKNLIQYFTMIFDTYYDEINQSFVSIYSQPIIDSYHYRYNRDHSLSDDDLDEPSEFSLRYGSNHDDEGDTSYETSTSLSSALYLQEFNSRSKSFIEDDDDNETVIASVPSKFFHRDRSCSEETCSSAFSLNYPLDLFIGEDIDKMEL